MRRLLPALLVAACGGGAATAAPPTPAPPVVTPDAAPALSPIAALTPPQLRGIWMGMPRAAVLAERPQLAALPTYPPSRLDGPRTTYEEQAYDGQLGRVRYHFRVGGDEPLYLVEIYYQDDAYAATLFAEAYAGRAKAGTTEGDHDVTIEVDGQAVRVWVMGDLVLKLVS